MARTVILAAGGTGGHMFPAQSLAEILAARGWRVVLTTDDRGMRYAGGFSDDVERVVLPTGSLAQGSLVKRVLVPFRILTGVWRAWALFSRAKPDAVVGFGGYPALPALLVARMRRVPYFIHEQNAILGRVNKLLHQSARKVACGLWPVKHVGANAVFLGNPVRGRVLPFEASALPDVEPFRLVVFGGSQGASIMSRLVPDALAAMPSALRRRVELVQQVRESELEGLRERYLELGVNCELAPFFSDMPERIAASHFVIARSGASTLAELQIIGRGSVLVPLPNAANDHQRANAKALVAAGAAFEYDEACDEPAKLAQWLSEIMNDRRRLAQMVDAAYLLARPKAAEALADLIEKELA